MVGLSFIHLKHIAVLASLRSKINFLSKEMFEFGRRVHTTWHFVKSILS